MFQLSQRRLHLNQCLDFLALMIVNKIIMEVFLSIGISKQKAQQLTVSDVTAISRILCIEYEKRCPIVRLKIFVLSMASCLNKYHHVNSCQNKAWIWRNWYNRESYIYESILNIVET